MATTVLDLCTDSARIVNIIDEIDQLSPEQGQMALTALNDMMLDMDRDGIELNWYKQTSLSNVCPIDDADMRCVKLCFARELAFRSGLLPTLPQDLKDEMDEAQQKLAKRTIQYFESDMSGLPVPQGAYWGGGRT